MRLELGRRNDRRGGRVLCLGLQSHAGWFKSIPRLQHLTWHHEKKEE